MPNRFVILHHRTRDGEHWDLMLEHGDALLTWQLLREPTGLAGLPIPAQRVSDHRKLYLDYEGPISGDRGTVRRVDAGAVSFLEETAACFAVELRSARFVGRFALRTVAGGWEFVSVPAPGAVDPGSSA